jgi:hypothetical protein
MFALRVEVLGFDAPGWMDSNTTVLFESALLLCLFYPLFLFLLPSFMPTHTHCPCSGENPSYGWQTGCLTVIKKYSLRDILSHSKI